mgnify:FL=1|tara:strand:- start:29679 stop:31013 length:1335 start_codon:yes stop_codon:yes gene_type:complete
METGKTLRGGAHLVLDAVDGVTHIVEGMYRNIAGGALPLGKAPEGPAPGIAGFVHTAVRQISGIARSGLDFSLRQFSPQLDSIAPPGPYREAIIAALNGVCGDHLARTDNPLAIPMRLRVALPGHSEDITEPNGEMGDAPDYAGEEPTPADAPRFAGLFDTQRRYVELYPLATAFADEDFNPGSRLLIAVHGLSMNDREWTSQNHNHIETLATEQGFTPVYVNYNSGKHISCNGRELSSALADLLASWPVPVESVTFVGFSMGGLVARSAMHIAQQDEQHWLSLVDKAVYVGTPHHGAVMERGGFWLQKLLTYSPYTAPFAVMGRIRSDGITDLRHGNLRDEDWQHHDEHLDNADYRVPTPLLQDVEHFAIAATLSKKSGERIGRLLGDGLVHPSSATGRHANPQFDLALASDHTRILYNVGHLAMLQDQRVMEQLTTWLGKAQ